MEGEALVSMWVLRALVLCKLSRTKPERQKRDLKRSKVLGLVGENLDLLWVLNFIPVLEIVHKTNENHWIVPQKQSNQMNLRIITKILYFLMAMINHLFGKIQDMSQSRTATIKALLSKYCKRNFKCSQALYFLRWFAANCNFSAILEWPCSKWTRFLVFWGREMSPWDFTDENVWVLNSFKYFCFVSFSVCLKLQG